MARAIDNLLAAIRTAVYGREVRSAIADGIEQCYDDATANAQIAQIEAKGAEVLDSIPSDYTELANEVDVSKSAFDNVTEHTNNLIEFNNKTFTVNNVSVTTNADGTMILNGTGSASGGRLTRLAEFYLPTGNYRLITLGHSDCFISDNNNNILITASNVNPIYTSITGQNVYFSLNVGTKAYDITITVLLVKENDDTTFRNPYSSIDRIARETIDKKTIIVNNVSELSNIVFSLGQTIHILGYYAPADGGGSICYVTNVQDATKLQYALNNNLYATPIDNDIVLPRYGGYTVNAMMDNARQYNIEFDWKNVILPEANPNHPGCVGWKTNCYSWTIDAPIVFDDNFNCSHVSFNGELRAKADMEAMIKIAGANKPENIYFDSPLILNGEEHEVDYGIFNREGARIVFTDVLINYCKTGVMIGGENSYGPGAEIEFNDIYVGYYYNAGIEVDGSNATVSVIGRELFIQNPIGNETIYGIKMTGKLSDCYIGIVGMYRNNGQYFKYPLYVDVDDSYGVVDGLTIGTLCGDGFRNHPYIKNCITNIQHYAPSLVPDWSLGAPKFWAYGNNACTINIGDMNSNTTWVLDGDGYTTVVIGYLTQMPNSIATRNFIVNGISSESNAPNVLNVTSNGVITLRRNSVNYPITT